VQDLQTGVIERVSMAGHDPAAKAAIDQGIHDIQVGVQAYSAADPGDLYPVPALVSESGLTPHYMVDWPVNPYTGGPMTQGVGPGDFGYTLAADSRSFTLTPHYGGSQSNDASDEPSISADGRYVAFASIATNLVSGDANGAADIFVHDRVTGATERESVSGTSAEGDSKSDSPAISADGRFVAFQSRASNLVTGDSNGTWDVFVRDRQSSTTTRVDVDSLGVQANGTSFGGAPAISANGRYVAFGSNATNLVSGDANGVRDVFVHDRTAGVTERVDVSDAGSVEATGTADTTAPSISADGRYVAFGSRAKNLVPADTWGPRGGVFVRDRVGGTTERVSLSSGSYESDGGYNPSISADGRYVAFISSADMAPGHAFGTYDVFLRDRLTGVTEWVSVTPVGGQSNGSVDGPAPTPSISGDGRRVVFSSTSTNLVGGGTLAGRNVFVRTRW